MLGNLKVKYLSNNLEKIKKTKVGDWIDLRCATQVNLKAGEFALIPLGVAIKIPNGYEAIIAPRSSSFKNWGIIQTNGIGVIDSSYCGNEDEWKMPVYATRNTTINQNDRVCQFRLLKNQPSFEIKEVDNLSDVSRGGFGSTGIN